MMNSKKTEALLTFCIGLMTVIILNQISAISFFRIDLTEEQRYTISDATIEVLENLEDVVYVDVYLEGALPAGFKRLQKSIRETLEEFKAYAGENIEFRFVNPGVAQSQKAKNQFYKSLNQKGIQPTNIISSENGEKSEKIIFPGAVVSYGTRETGVMLLKGNRSAGPQEALNQSIENIEYELATAITKLTGEERKKIGLIHGHGELDTLENAGMATKLLEMYNVYNVNLPARKNLQGYDAIVVAKPKEAFTEEDIFKIDQFIMNGGRAAFFIDQLAIDMDSIGGAGTIAIPLDLGLSSLFFRYGIRFNPEYALDLNCGSYPVVVGNMGNQPQIRLMPFPYFPLINQYSDHPVVKNTDAILTRFVGTIDTVKAEGIEKTPLMLTSENTRTVPAPAPVSLNDLRADLKPSYFQGGQKIIAWILEGRFTSAYHNRILPEGIDTTGFTSRGKATKIIFCSDGDIVRNEINPKTNKPQELGFDPITSQRYANSDFILNAMNYLLNEDGIISARSKEIKIRPLDKVKLQQEKTLWQLINLIIPIFLIILFGIVKNILRKQKYARF